MNKAIVLLGTLAAVGAGWAAQEHVFTEVPPPRTRLRGDFRHGGGGSSVAPSAGVPGAPAVPAPVAPAAPGAVKPAAPTAPVAAPPKVEPPKPPAPIRRVTDPVLAIVANSVEVPAGKVREVHVDIENLMTRPDAKGKTEYKDFKHLGADLRANEGAAFVIVADAQVPWRQVRDMLVAGQNNYATNAFLGVARKDDPTLLRCLPITQTARSDDPLPAGATFQVKIESKEGAPVVSVDGRKLETFPSDLALAWSDWKKAHPDLADTSDPATTHVVLDVPKSARVGVVVQVFDVLRGIGIRSERLTGDAAFRAMK